MQLQRETSSRPKTGNLDKQVINDLFAIMKLSYPNKFMAKMDQEELHDNMRFWHNKLSIYPKEKIDAAVRIMADRHPSWPPDIGEFQVLIKESTPRREHQDAPRIERVIISGEREKALAATRTAYAARYPGMPSSRHDYEGDFDFKAVAELAPLAETGSLIEHKDCWSLLGIEFSKAWDKFIKGEKLCLDQ